MKKILILISIAAMAYIYSIYFVGVHARDASDASELNASKSESNLESKTSNSSTCSGKNFCTLEDVKDKKLNEKRP